MNWIKKIMVGIGVIILILTSLFYFLIYPKLLIASGYAAKNACSCIFVGGINEETVMNEDINFNVIKYASTIIDYENKTATSSVFGMQTKTAYYSPNTGCALIQNLNPEEIYRYSNDWKIKKYDSLENWFSYIDTVEHLSISQTERLSEAINSGFLEDNPLLKKKNSRAAVVLYKGQLVGEQYSPGFDKDSRLLGWSMTKSYTSTMIGMLANEGKFKLDEPIPIKEWQQDDRKNITWIELLHMNSGLKWEEEYLDITDAVKMFFMSDGAGEYAAQLPKLVEPNTTWEYSSGTTNIMARELRKHFNSNDEYVRYIYDQLFYKIGMYSMLMETDAKGIFVGSSYSWATARDLAKIGQLYLQNGNWAGEQILTKEWVDFVQQPAPNSNDRYGGHFWLNKGGFYPDAPRDMYSITGFMGQRVYIIPSKELVIVRLGLTENRADFDFNDWIKGIIKSVE